ncbi:homeodomain transcription factor 2 [Schistosoma japonicum]|nr:homeodomain transcription factor 2 [Schistosoma japonicum]
MLNFEFYAKRFQLKLSNYDKHPWEHGIEQRILQGIDQHAARDGKPRAGLIDVDVIRGSVFAKAKPGHGWMSALRWGLLRVAFAPFYWNYWRGHTSFRVAVYMMVHFFLQFLQVVFFLMTDPRTSSSSQDDVLLPCLLAICLGILHAHITAPHSKTGICSSFIDNPTTAQSFKDINNHNLNSNCCSYNSDALVNNKYGNTHAVINRHNECDYSSWLPVQSITSEQRRFPNNIYSMSHQSINVSNFNKEQIHNTTEQFENSNALSNDCLECYNSPHLMNENCAKIQKNIHWRPSEMKPKRPSISSYKFLKTHLDSNYQDDYSTLYGCPGDATRHELNVSDFMNGTDGGYTSCILDEECGRTKHLHNSQVLEHRPRVVRRRRRLNSYNTKHSNSGRGHDADVEESEGEHVTIPVKKDVSESGHSDQCISLHIVNDLNPNYVPQSRLEESIDRVGSFDFHSASCNSDINHNSTVLPREKQASEFPSNCSSLHNPAKLSETLDKDFSGTMKSSSGGDISKRQSASDSSILFKTNQFTESEGFMPHISHISSLSSSLDSVTESSYLVFRRSLSMSFLEKRKKNIIMCGYSNSGGKILKKSFSDGLLSCSGGYDSSKYHLFDNNDNGLHYVALKSSSQQKRNFQSVYSDSNDQDREVVKLSSSSPRGHLTNEMASCRKISFSSHSSAAVESSTNSARSFSSVRNCRSSADQVLDKKTHSSYIDVPKSHLTEDINSSVQPVELSKEFQKLNGLNEKCNVQLNNCEFKNKSYDCINKYDDTITVFNKQRAKYLRLFLQRASNLQQPRTFTNPSHTDTDIIESESVILNNKRLNGNLKNSGKYIPLPADVDINFKSFNQRSSSSNFANIGCLKSTAKKAFYNWSEANSLFGNINNWSTTTATTTTDIANSQGSFRVPRRNMNQYINPIGGFSRDAYSHPHYFSKDESHDTNMNTRGQTASETEYFDRINSDLGSDIDSSSCPDEVESPSQHPCNNELQNWQHSNPKPEVNVNPREEFQTVDTNQVSMQPGYHSRISKHYCPKCSSRINVFPSPPTDSGQFNSFEDFKRVENSNHQKSAEPHKSYESLQTVNASENNECVSSVHEEVLHSVNVEVKEKQFDSQTTKENFRKIHIKSHLRSESHSHENLLTSKTDTVRCYMWAGEKFSKFNLSMLDIGKSVIYAVERQSISTDYIIFACIATFALPFISVIFHSTNSSIIEVDNYNNSQYHSPSITEDGKAFLVDYSTNQTFTINNSVFGNSVIGLYLHALLSLFHHILLTVTTKLYTLLIDTNIQASYCSRPYCIIFRNIISGQFLVDWFSKPDIQGRLVILIGFILRFNVYGTVFFLLCIAERTFQERLLYAKYFFSLTSGRRALKYRVPQFRLNKVGHIKCWLMLRSYLKKRGPQRSVEHIMTIAFYILLSKSRTCVFAHLTNWDILGLSFGIIVFLYRFILLGAKITKKYLLLVFTTYLLFITCCAIKLIFNHICKNLFFNNSLTELNTTHLGRAINLYLSMESKPHKKEDLMLTFQVLRLVEGLLKEVDGPFRVCGWTLNPLVYNIFKLVLLSCVSTLLSESLGFKLKLYKLKLNPSNW